MRNRKCLLLYPFSFLYRLITDTRNILYNTGIRKSKEYNIPIICIGNLTVGGTGKTPMTEYLINLLHGDFKVAVLSRGYKRKSRGLRIAGNTSTVSETGDEPLQIYKKFPDTLVVVERDRNAGIRTIIKNFPSTDLIILDDGFQHRSVKPGFSILLTDFNRIMTRDHLMPYGNLREKSANRKRAHIIIITKTPEKTTDQELAEIKNEVMVSPGQKLFFTKIQYHELIPLFGNTVSERPDLTESPTRAYGLILVTGIAQPGTLLRFLENYFKEIIHLNFPDHHYFRINDVERITSAWKKLRSNDKILITTEKDAVRLKEFTIIEDSIKRASFYIPVGISFLNDTGQEFNNLIIDYVRKDKQGNRIP